MDSTSGATMSNKTALVTHDNGATIARKRKRPLGRRTILDAKLTKQICDLLAAGNSIKTTMELMGRDESTYYDWIQKGEQGEKRIYVQFVKRTSRARGKAKKTLVKIIVKQAPARWVCWVGLF